MNNSIIIIPSRLGSTRLVNKPLANINGKTMIIRVAEQAKKTNISDIYIAAAENEIITEAQKNGFKAILTNPSHPSGTDRIYEALEKISGNFDFIVNLQGDLPTIAPEIINNLLDLINNSNFDIVTAVAPIIENNEKTNPNIVKAIVSWQTENTGKALYFTRATAPHNAEEFLHHIGIYVYKKAALEKFVKLMPSKLEKTEKLEQLRALENNMTIGVLKVNTIPLGVDTAEDLEKAIYMFKNNLVK